MSGPAYVVLPVPSDGAKPTEQDTAKIASAIEQSLHDNTPHKDHEEEHSGPLKEILAHQDSLYKYISWEDPIRTICSYIGALSILFGAHYLPLTQLGLKAGAFALGVVTVTEFASRSFGTNTFLARLRPKEYKKVPESTLNATLKDIHDLIQYSAEQTQRVLFGQDLHKTFSAFLGFTALYLSIKVLSPFSLAVLVLTSLFIAPLAASPRGREVAQDARLRAGELTNAAVANGKALAQGGRIEVAEQSSKAQEAASDTQQCIGRMAHSGKQTAADLSAQARGTADDLSDGAKGTDSGISEFTAETVRYLPGRTVDASNQTASTINSALLDAKQ